MKSETIGDVERLLDRELTLSEMLGIYEISIYMQLNGRVYTARMAANDIKAAKPSARDPHFCDLNGQRVKLSHPCRCADFENRSH